MHCLAFPWLGVVARLEHARKKFSRAFYIRTTVILFLNSICSFSLYPFSSFLYLYHTLSRHNNSNFKIEFLKKKKKNSIASLSPSPRLRNTTRNQLHLHFQSRKVDRYIHETLLFGQLILPNLTGGIEFLHQNYSVFPSLHSPLMEGVVVAMATGAKHGES